MDTGTLSELANRREYSREEEIVLRHFFTNVDRNVYCATDAMPMALWAFLEGGYSRSDLSMRDRFLRIFEEMQEEAGQGRIPAAEAPTLEQVASSISFGREIHLGAALDKASSFMSKWAVDYGHNSLKDSSVDRFAIEGVSQRAAKLLEATPLGAFQEKSTRYLDFSQDRFVFPSRLTSSTFGAEAREQVAAQMDAYRTLLGHVMAHLFRVVPAAEFRSAAAWKRTVKARAFDVARYLLPSAVCTSLGATIPTRETERLISALLASPHEEVRGIGAAMLEEAVKINPGLLRHVAPNAYAERTVGDLAGWVARTLATEPAPRPPRAGAELVWASPQIEDYALASLLEATGCFQEGLSSLVERVRRGGQKLRDEIARRALAGRGPHDEWPRELGVGQLAFDIVLDFGAFRDLQRHRVGTQIRCRLTSALGYSVPELLEQTELAESRGIYCAAMDRLGDFAARVAQELPDEAEYLVALGHNCLYTYACDLRQWAYLVELRSGPSGHISYRRIAHRMASEVLPLVPSLAPYLRVDWSGAEADRRQAEERTQAKLAALRGSSPATAG